MKDKTVLTIRIEDDLKKQLEKEAKAETRSITQQVGHIIKLYFKDHKKDV